MAKNGGVPGLIIVIGFIAYLLSEYWWILLVIASIALLNGLLSRSAKSKDEALDNHSKAEEITSVYNMDTVIPLDEVNMPDTQILHYDNACVGNEEPTNTDAELKGSDNEGEGGLYKDLLETRILRTTSAPKDDQSARIEAFILQAFQKVQDPYAQKVISYLGRLKGTYSRLEDESRSLYQYCLDIAEQRIKHSSSEDTTLLFEDIKNLVLKFKETADDIAVIDWLNGNVAKSVIQYDDSERKVIEWPHVYVFSADELDKATPEQKEFYLYFKEQFLNGRYLDLDGNLNYAFILMFDLAKGCQSRESLDALNTNLTILAEKYPKTGNYIQKVLRNANSNVVSLKSEKMLAEIEKTTATKAKWIKDGEVVELAGLKLVRGNFYLGAFQTVYKDNLVYSYDRKMKVNVLAPVVNPDLEVRQCQESPLSAFSSYTSLTPEQRYQYLRFLSREVSASEVSHSLFNLYLLGIEFRLFVDKNTPAAEKEDLVKTLVQLYEERQAPDDQYNYRDNLVSLIDSGMSVLKPKKPKSILGDFRFLSLSNYTKILMTEYCPQGQNLSPEKAFEFADKFFEITKELPSGEKNVEAVKRRFEEVYQEAPTYQSQYYSSYYSGESTVSVYMSSHIYDEFFTPDTDEVVYRIPTSYSGNPNMYSIQNAANRIHWDSGRHWDLLNANRGETTPYCDMNFASYLDPSAQPSLVELAQKIDSMLDTEGYAMIPVKEFVKWIQYPPRKEKGIFKSYALVIVEALRKMGYGIAPNPSVEGDRLMFDSNCCLHKLENDSPLSPDSLKGQAVVKMAAQVAMADKISSNDIHLIESGLASLGFEGNTLKYEAAYARVYSSSKQNFYNSKVIQEFSESEIDAIYKLLLRMTFNGGDVSTERVKILKRYCKYLGQDSEKIHSGIHVAMTTDEFATVEKTMGAVRFSIPKPDEVTHKFAIDTGKLERMEKQTKEAQEMLSDIFVEEQNPVEKKPSGEMEAIKDILSTLLDKDVWDFAEVDELCKYKGLMTGFVLEKINDFSYENVDDAVLDQDGDQIYVTTDYKEQLI